MILGKFDPQKKQRFAILDEKGKLIAPEYEPKIDEKTLLKMYRTMKLARIADIRALQYQRQFHRPRCFQIRNARRHARTRRRHQQGLPT